MYKELDISHAAREGVRRLVGLKNTETVSGKGPTIVVVHGFAGGWEMHNFKKLCEANNQKALLVEMGFQLMSASIYVEQLGEQIKKYLGQEPYIGLGYSMGGLLLLRHAQEANWQQVEKIIAIATPFDGVSGLPVLAKWIPALKDMAPESKFFSSLDWHSIPRGKLIAVFGDEDKVARAGATLPHEVQQLDLPGNHSAIINNGENLKKIFTICRQIEQS